MYEEYDSCDFFFFFFSSPFLGACAGAGPSDSGRKRSVASDFFGGRRSLRRERRPGDGRTRPAAAPDARRGRRRGSPVSSSRGVLRVGVSSLFCFR